MCCCVRDARLSSAVLHTRTRTYLEERIERSEEGAIILLAVMEASIGHRRVVVARQLKECVLPSRALIVGDPFAVAPPSVCRAIPLYCAVLARAAKVAEEVDGDDREDAHEDQHKDKRGRHAGDRAPERDEDGVQRFDALKQPQDAEGAEDLEHRERAEVDAHEREGTDNHDGGVEVVPRVHDKRVPKVAVEVDGELEEEEDIADVVDRLPSGRIPLVDLLGVWVDLLLDDNREEIDQDHARHCVLHELGVVEFLHLLAVRQPRHGLRERWPPLF